MIVTFEPQVGVFLELTTVELAAEIRKEGRLGTHMMIDLDTGLRCAWGVICDAQPASSEQEVHLLCNKAREVAQKEWWEDGIVEVFAKHVGGHIASVNDTFPGTPEQRAAFMADLFESLP